MENFSNDVFTILNYQGSKKNLLNFIYKNTIDVIDEKKAVFDIFAGSCSVGYALKRYYRIFANDSEVYSLDLCQYSRHKNSNFYAVFLKASSSC